MILRRLMKHVREQNWFAVGLDLTIVIVGVFLGFQVTEWNEARRQAELSEGYLQRILLEVERDADRARDRRITWAAQVENGEAALDYLESGTLVDGSVWRTVQAFYFVGDVNALRSEQSTFEELRDSGRLDLIANPDIRRFLIRYADFSGNASVHRVRNPDTALYWHTRRLTPHAIANHIEENCLSWSNLADSSLLFPCDPPADPDTLTMLLDRYASDPAFIELLNATTSAHADNVRMSDYLIGLLMELTNQIRSELGLPPITEPPHTIPEVDHTP